MKELKPQSSSFSKKASTFNDNLTFYQNNQDKMEQKICHVSKSQRSGFTEILIAQKRVSVLNGKTNTISVLVLGRWEEVKKKKVF